MIVRDNGWIGSVFGRWTVTAVIVDESGGKTMWLCRCVCGTERAVRPYRAANGESQSCGCLHKERVRAKTGRPVHGMSGTPEYQAWQAMKNRTGKPQSPSFKWYGARGIKMDPTWQTSFASFFAHVGPRPSAEHSLGRIDNDGHYEPGNVEWQTIHQQNGNKRSKAFPKEESPLLKHAKKRRKSRTNVEGPAFFWKGKWREA